MQPVRTDYVLLTAQFWWQQEVKEESTTDRTRPLILNIGVACNVLKLLHCYRYSLSTTTITPCIQIYQLPPQEHNVITSEKKGTLYC